MGDADLDLVEHAKCVRWARTGAQGERREREEAFLFDYGRKKGPKVAKRLKRLMDGSAWLTRVPSRLDGTQLTRWEWHDVVSLRYGFRPVGLIQQCDGCGANFSVGHALSCKKGGLIGWRHNDTRDEWAWLCTKALPPSHVSTKPIINGGAHAGARAGSTGKAAAANSSAESGVELREDRVEFLEGPLQGYLRRPHHGHPRKREGRQIRGGMSIPIKGLHAPCLFCRWDAR